MRVKFTPEESVRFADLSKKLCDDKDFCRMKEYVAHGSINVYQHSINVAKLAYLLKSRMKLKTDDRVLVEGALLHDFYLYDWHDAEIGLSFSKLHGYTHPFTACKNAISYYGIDDSTQEVIRCHMWPLTLRSLPRSKEAILVCIADKVCALKETILR